MEALLVGQQRRIGYQQQKNSALSRQIMRL